ncbi:hypothetical protein SBOR_9420 [Sclerotinia borealis F-4128]|uniref:PHD and RING finger domain-containing protein n=1 Tax=Sclerotinia borealis (strain F-4128) TaxID=1432307 RepID=W9C2S6_SCLBF|nr:hypothetical protein SBOR_9420 [Sclerotinia borealis F-4128]
MTDACIVCLEDLEVQLEVVVQVPVPVPVSVVQDPKAILYDDLEEGGKEVTEELYQHQYNYPGNSNNQQSVAQIKPCGHVLHDDCLREWSRKANSCPICRASFNLVVVLDRVGGTVLSEYTVEDRKQTAEFNLTEWQENNPDEYEDEEEGRSCPICDQSDQEDVLLLCDGCDAPYHTHCIGLSNVPGGHWYCMECVESGAFSLHDESQGPARTIPFSGPNISRTQASVRRARRNGRQDRWINAWGQLSSAIRNVAGVDLDFAEDDQEIRGYRDLQQFSAAEFMRWEQRMHIARRQGAGRIFRAAAPQAMRERIEPPAPVVETRAERQAWGAMERAQHLEDTPNTIKRTRSTTSSPASRGGSTPEEPERKQKRPRTRIVQNGLSSVASSSTNPHPQPESELEPEPEPEPEPRRSNGPTNPLNTNSVPTFLSSLLREVEMAPSSDDDSVRFGPDVTFNRTNGATSPSFDCSSPATSPASPASSYHSRAMSITPPPRSTQSRSPPLSTSVMPDFSAIHYSPNRSPSADSISKSPNQNKKKRNGSPGSPIPEIRQPQPRRHKISRVRSRHSSTSRSENISPVRNNMSIEEKESINKMVKTALGPHWKSQKISMSNEQYAHINRNVSRKLYELIADKKLPDGDKSLWEKIATSEVSKAVQTLTKEISPSGI